MALDDNSFSIFLDTIKKFVDNKLIPREQEVEDTNSIPIDIVREMKDIGLFGISIPTKYGGSNLSMEQEVKLTFELGRASPAFRSMAGTNIGIGSQTIVMAGTDKQKNKYLPKFSTGDIIGSFALTEPDSGSDAMSIKTTAKKKGNEYIINGTKRYITNAPIAGVFSVMAKTKDEKSSSSISCFLVDSDLPGITLGKPDKKMGQRGALTSDIIFDNCIVKEDALLGGREGIGFTTAMRVLDKGRLHISGICVGLSERLLNEALKFATSRKQFNEEISNFQLIQSMIADSKAEILAAKGLIISTATMRDKGKNVTLESSCAKLFCSEILGKIADRAVQIHGGAGYMSEYAVERLYRDARLFRIYEGTSQIQQLIIARETIKNFKA
ncbi:MAG: Acyl-CoA dehydrogenase [Alphaproteobacteria bacterium MarineAlpha9_Bin3]|nr:MAG: Acyl-CoA dehydrogenase [Alphaproteobacteria bacterium MarineAlpha9_Bin3]|tara:strand:+ start:5994 stop:7145 length:1152 start_codon:yes stop_codon:yes gene_type:complete